MSIQYICKYCTHSIGEITEDHLRYGELKFSLLHTNDYQDMITVLSNGDVYVRTVCEDCEDYVRNYDHEFNFENFLQ